MKKFLEFFQQQDGAYCALQFVVIFSFITTWITWVIECFKHSCIQDIPTGVVAILTAMLAAKVWKDRDDSKTL